MDRNRLRTRRGLTMVEVLLIVGVLVILIALLLPAVRSGGRGAARRAQCTNNLKLIAMALFNYESSYGGLPPAYTVDARGKPLHSWRTLILPFMEQGEIYKEIDLSRPWDDPVNSTAATRRVSIFLCPSAFPDGAKTNYLAVVGQDSLFAPGRPRRLAEITDGLSTTVALIDVGREYAVPWMAPYDTNSRGVDLIVKKAKSQHPGGVNAALADSSVRFLKSTTPTTTLRALGTISGNDNDAVKDW